MRMLPIHFGLWQTVYGWLSSVLQFSLKVGFENSLIGIPFGSFRQG